MDISRVQLFQRSGPLSMPSWGKGLSSEHLKSGSQLGGLVRDRAVLPLASANFGSIFKYQYQSAISRQLARPRCSTRWKAKVNRRVQEGTRRSLFPTPKWPKWRRPNWQIRRQADRPIHGNWLQSQRAQNAMWPPGWQPNLKILKAVRRKRCRAPRGITGNGSRPAKGLEKLFQDSKLRAAYGNHATG